MGVKKNTRLSVSRSQEKSEDLGAEPQDSRSINLLDAWQEQNIVGLSMIGVERCWIQDGRSRNLWASGWQEQKLVGLRLAGTETCCLWDSGSRTL